MQISDESFRTRGYACLIAILALTMSALVPANASTFKVLHSFCRKLYCGDGGAPQQGLTIDQAGNLYGTAGGSVGGIVFELVTPTTGRRWRYRVIHKFCAFSNCADGAYPAESTLVVDTSGNLYGTTSNGGAGNDTGTVFELSPPITGHQWSLHTLYNFCVTVSSCHDGETPSGGLTYAGREAGLPYDGVSPLYGITAGGGAHFGGVAFSLSHNQQGHWIEHVLYTFCQQGGQSCTDGATPVERMTMDSSGNLYGSTAAGGANNAGVAFELSTQSRTEKSTEIILHDFGDTSLDVVSGLFIDQTGNLFGFGAGGGSGAQCSRELGCGTAFEISADRTFSVLYNFCELKKCADGDAPLNRGGTYMDGQGNLFGTTSEGGKNNQGIIFKLSSDGIQVLHNFCKQAACLDGAFPSGGLVKDSAGNLFGTTLFGGAYNTSGGGGGTVFELSP